MYVDLGWKLARDILTGKRSQLYNFSVSTFFTLHENVRFGSITEIDAT